MTTHNPSEHTAAAVVTVNEAAEYMKCSRWTVYRLVREGALKPLKVGTHIRFRIRDLDAYMER